MADFDPNHIEKKIFFRIGQKCVIFNDKDKILFLRRSDKASRSGGWDFPGGALEHEDPYQGIIRETHEETGLVTYGPQLLLIETQPEGQPVLMIGYSARTNEEIVTLSWEHSDHTWLSREEAARVELPPFHLKLLNKALSVKQLHHATS